MNAPSWSLITDVIFIALITLAALSDIEKRKVSNSLNFTLLLMGLALSILGVFIPSIHSIDPLQSLAGIGLSLAVLIFPFAWRIYQGGDVKLCMGMGAWLGSDGALRVIGLGVVAGGLVGLGVVIARRLSRLASRDESVEARSRSGQDPFTIPMAVCFAGAGAWVYLKLPIPW